MSYYRIGPMTNHAGYVIIRLRPEKDDGSILQFSKLKKEDWELFTVSPITLNRSYRSESVEQNLTCLLNSNAWNRVETISDFDYYATLLRNDPVHGLPASFTVRPVVPQQQYNFTLP